MIEDNISVAILLNNENIPKDIFKSSVDDYFGPQVEDFKESSLSVCILSESTGLTPSKNNAATFSKSQWLFQTKFPPNQKFEFQLVICDNQSWNTILSEDSSINREIDTLVVESDKIMVVHLEWNKPHTVSVQSLLELHSLDESLIKSHYENQDALEIFKNLETIKEDNYDEESLIDSLQESDKQSDENKIDIEESDDSLEADKAFDLDKYKSLERQKSDSSIEDSLKLDGNLNLPEDQLDIEIKDQSELKASCELQRSNTSIDKDDFDDSLKLEENINLPKDHLELETKDESDLKLEEDINIPEDNLELETKDESDLKLEENINLPEDHLELETKDEIDLKLGEDTNNPEDNLELETKDEIDLKLEDDTNIPEDNLDLETKDESDLKLEENINIPEDHIDLETKDESDSKLEENINLPVDNLDLETKDEIDLKLEENINIPEDNLELETKDESDLKLEENINLPEDNLELETKDESNIKLEENINLPEDHLELETKDESNIKLEEDTNIPEDNLELETKDEIDLKLEENISLPEDNLDLEAKDERDLKLEEDISLPEDNLDLETKGEIDLKLEEDINIPEDHLDLEAKDENDLKLEENINLPEDHSELETKDEIDLKLVEDTNNPEDHLELETKDESNLKLEENINIPEDNLELETKDEIDLKLKEDINIPEDHLDLETKDESDLKLEDDTNIPEDHLELETKDEIDLKLEEDINLPEDHLELDTKDEIDLKLEEDINIPEDHIDLETKDESDLKLEENINLPEDHLELETKDEIDLKLEENIVLPGDHLELETKDESDLKLEENINIPEDHIDLETKDESDLKASGELQMPNNSMNQVDLEESLKLDENLNLSVHLDIETKNQSDVKTSSEPLLINDSCVEEKVLPNSTKLANRKSILLTKIQSIMGVKSELERIRRNMKNDEATINNRVNLTEKEYQVKQDDSNNLSRLDTDTNNIINEFPQEEISEKENIDESENVKVNNNSILKEENIPYENIEEVEAYCPDNANFEKYDPPKSVCCISVSDNKNVEDIEHLESPLVMDPVENICVDVYQESVSHSEINTHTQLHLIDNKTCKGELDDLDFKDLEVKENDILICQSLDNSKIVTEIEIEDNEIDNDKTQIPEKIEELIIGEQNVSEFMSEEEIITNSIGNLAEEELIINDENKENLNEINQNNIIRVEELPTPKIVDDLVINMNDQTFEDESVTNFETEESGVTNAREVLTSKIYSSECTTKDEIIIIPTKNQTKDLQINEIEIERIDRKTIELDKSEMINISYDFTKKNTERSPTKFEDLPILENVNEIRYNVTEIKQNPRSENGVKLDILQTNKGKSDLTNDKTEVRKFVSLSHNPTSNDKKSTNINENINIKTQSDKEFARTSKDVNKIKSDYILKSTTNLKEDKPENPITKNEDEIKFQEIKLRINNNVIPLDESCELQVSNDPSSKENQPRVSDIIERFEALNKIEKTIVVPVNKSNTNRNSNNLRISQTIDKFNEKEDIKINDPNKVEILKKSENRQITSDKIANVDIIYKSNYISDKAEPSIKLIVTECTSNESINSEKVAELRLNDDYMYPDSITPTKVEQNLSKLIEYDVPFIDDDMFYKENWYKESNDRWSTLEKSKIVNAEISLTPVSEKTLKCTPRASIETLKELDVEKMKMTINFAEPERKKKGLMSLCGCVGGGRKRSILF